MLPVIVSLFVSVLVTRIVGGPECWKTLLGMRSKCDPPNTARYKCISIMDKFGGYFLRVFGLGPSQPVPGSAIVGSAELRKRRHALFFRVCPTI